MRKPNRKAKALRRGVLAISLSMIAFALTSMGNAFANTEKTLHSFCNESGCRDGDTPRNGLLMDSSGDLYGTTEFGGKYDKGLLFKLIPNAAKTKYTEHILKNFCAKSGCTDGGYPNSELIMDVDGNLYGTTETGGARGDGEVFKMRPVTNGWVFSLVHSFCSAPPDCTDGGVPYGGLAYAGQVSGALWDESSPLFGTSSTGGSKGKGTVYELSPNGSGWTYQRLHSFNPTQNVESVYPAPLLVDSSGNLFGVTYYGAANGAGALYRLAAGTWKETTLHNFCAEPNCTDGNGGYGRLTMDVAGNIYGTTLSGGSGSNCQEPNGCGVVFERTAGGNYKVIYNLCSRTNCRDGDEPSAGLTMDAAGNLYGVTHIGGKGNLGVAFMLSHGGGWNETVLYAFCSETNCTDGAAPGAPLNVDTGGNVYGTTSEDGGNGSGGTVFRLTP